MAAAIEKKVDSKTSDTSTACASLPFGALRRSLFTVIEGHIYSFLDSEDFAELLFVSRGFAKTAVRAVQNTKRLLAQRISKFAWQLAVKHCQKLEELSFVNSKLFDDLPRQFAPLIWRNKATLRKVSSLHAEAWTNLALKHLTLCPRLTELDLVSTISGPQFGRGLMPGKVIDKIRPDILPQLCSLRLQCVEPERFGGGNYQGSVTGAQLFEILARDFEWHSLDIHSPPEMIVVSLAHKQRFGKVHTLILAFRSIKQTMLEDFAAAFRCMPALAHLELRHTQFSFDLTCQPLRETVWTLPLLQKLVPSGLLFLPRIVAPELQTARLIVELSMTTIAFLAEQTLAWPQLTSLHANALDWHDLLPLASAEIASALHGGRWPKLNELCWSPADDANADIFSSLCHKPRPNLSVLNCSVPRDRVRLCLSMHPLLTDVELCAASHVRADGIDTDTVLLQHTHLANLKLRVGGDIVFSRSTFTALRSLALSDLVHMTSIDLVLDACPVLQQLEIQSPSSVFEEWLPSRTCNSLTSLRVSLPPTLSVFADTQTFVSFLAAFPSLTHVWLLQIRQAHAENTWNTLLSALAEALKRPHTRLLQRVVDFCAQASDQAKATRDVVKNLVLSLPALEVCIFNVDTVAQIDFRSWIVKETNGKVRGH